MTLYAWIDENGNWRVSHFPPDDGSATLQIMLAPGADHAFFDQQALVEIEVEVSRPTQVAAQMRVYNDGHEDEATLVTVVEKGDAPQPCDPTLPDEAYGRE